MATCHAYIRRTHWAGWDGVQGNTYDPFQEPNVFQTTI